jgi:hypothetical protein
MEGFKKDVDICLTGVPAKNRQGITHAYFPALMSCCATLEYLADLFLGRNKALSRGAIQQYADRFLPQPAYDAETIRVLWELFRNGIAHHGITSGVWIDKHAVQGNRRLTWSVDCDGASAIEVKAEAGSLSRDPPWPTSYTHRASILIRPLSRDIAESADRFAAALDAPLLKNFDKCMRKLYPPDPA